MNKLSSNMRRLFRIRNPKQKKSFGELPSEIIIHIIELLPPYALPPVIATSRWFRNIAEPILYRYIDTRGRYRRTLRLYTTLLARPLLATHIKSFDAEDFVPYEGRKVPRRSSWRFNNAQTEPTKEDHVLHLCKTMAFRLMTCNEALYLGQGSWEWFRTTPPHVLYRMPLQKLVLNELHWSFNDGLSSVIRDHPLITHLELPLMLDDVSSIQPGEIPDLQTFAGEAQAAVHIIPGRPVTHLTLKSSSPFFPNNYDEALRILAKSTAQLCYLQIEISLLHDDDAGWADGGGLMGSIARHHPDLTELSLKGSFGSSLWENMMANILADLKQFSKLRTLTLRDCYTDTSGPFAYFNPDHSQCSAILDEWKSACPTLDKVVFADGCEWTSLRGRWHSGCERLSQDVPKLDERTFKNDLARSKWWNRR